MLKSIYLYSDYLLPMLKIWPIRFNQGNILKAFFVCWIAPELKKEQWKKEGLQILQSN